MNDKPVFTAYIKNFYEYEKGRDVGGWLEFPTTSERSEAFIKNIGFNSMDKAEYIFAKVTADESEIGGCIPEIISIDEANNFALMYKALSPANAQKYISMLENPKGPTGFDEAAAALEDVYKDQQGKRSQLQKNRNEIAER